MPNTSEYDKGLKFLNTLDNVLHETKQDALFGINTNAWIQEENFQRHAYNEAVLWINANSNYTFRFVTEAYGIMEGNGCTDDVDPADYWKYIDEYQHLLHILKDRHNLDNEIMQPQISPNNLHGNDQQGTICLSFLSPSERSNNRKKRSLSVLKKDSLLQKFPTLLDIKKISTKKVKHFEKIKLECSFTLKKDDTQESTELFSYEKNNGYFLLDIGTNSDLSNMNICTNTSAVGIEKVYKFGSVSRHPNIKFVISHFLTFFFQVHKHLISNHIKDQQFKRLRNLMMTQYSAVDNRLMSFSDTKQFTKTYFKFKYQNLVWYLGIAKRCQCGHLTNLVMSNNRIICYHNRKIQPMDVDKDSLNLSNISSSENNKFKKKYRRRFHRKIRFYVNNFRPIYITRDRINFYPFHIQHFGRRLHIDSEPSQSPYQQFLNECRQRQHVKHNSAQPPR